MDRGERDGVGGVDPALSKEMMLSLLYKRRKVRLQKQQQGGFWALTLNWALGGAL